MLQMKDTWDRRWVRREVKSAVGEGGTKKADDTVGAPDTGVGQASSHRAPQWWSVIFETFTISALQTMMWKCQMLDLRAKPNTPFPFGSSLFI